MRNLDEVFAALSKSRFRSRFALRSTERSYLATKGRDSIAEHARAFVQQRLAPARPRNDGRQTPMRGHPVFVAQHATATCCRECLAKWHGIDDGLALDTDTQARVVATIMRWLDTQSADTACVGRKGHAKDAASSSP